MTCLSGALACLWICAVGPLPLSPVVPELPEVETVRRSLESLTGQKLAAVQVVDGKLRYPVPRHFGAAATGKKLLSIERIGKYLLWKFADEIFVFHLGMTGRLLLNQKTDSPYLKLRFRFRRNTVDFIDVRRFGFVLSGDAARRSLPQSTDALQISADALAKSKMRRSRSPVKNLLLDQAILAGLGNIYLSELLFIARIDPRRAGDTLSKEELKAIAAACRNVLKRAIEAKGSSISDYVYSLPGEKAFQTGSYQKSFLVYSRDGEACKNCGTKIQRIMQSGRSTFFCPLCQV